MRKLQCSLERFLDDVKNHELTILNDDGLNRHIRMKRPGNSAYYYDIITWNGYLTICGDMGTYVFQRISDMFQFFIMHDNDFNKSKTEKISINPGYWGEKLEAYPRRGYKEFDEDKLKDNINDYFDSHFPIDLADDIVPLHDDESDEEYEARCKAANEYVKNFVMDAAYDDIRYCDSECDYYAAIRDFHFAENVEVEGYEDEVEVDFQFDDFWEYSSEVYTFHYIWCLYAIVHAIQTYNEHKAKS
jgi:hypothetical protein